MFDINNVTVLGRYIGALLGAAIGDALGAPFETKKAPEVAEMIDTSPLTYRDFEDPFKKGRIIHAGSVTNNTELAYAFAQSLIITDDFITEDQFQRYRALVHGGALSPFTGMPAYGFGELTKQMLAHETLTAATADSDMPCRASNGSLMRIAPLALGLGTESNHELQEIVLYASMASGVTHTHPLARSICATYTSMLRELLRGTRRRVAWITGIETARLCIADVTPHITAVLMSPWIDTGLMRGAALETLRIALCALLKSESVSEDNFRVGIEWTIRQGGDTDTNAAVAGALLGAHYGVSAIPEEWIKGLYGETATLIRKAAYDLYKQGHET